MLARVPCGSAGPILLKLKRAPAGCDALSLPEFPSGPGQAHGRGSQVGGLTLCGTVRGHGWAMDSDGLISFVEDSGEAGNSGTYMVDISTRNDGSVVPLCFYKGVEKSFLKRDMKVRGLICPPPDFATLRCGMAL